MKGSKVKDVYICVSPTPFLLEMFLNEKDRCICMLCKLQFRWSSIFSPFLWKPNFDLPVTERLLSYSYTEPKAYYWASCVRFYLLLLIPISDQWFMEASELDNLKSGLSFRCLKILIELWVEALHVLVQWIGCSLKATWVSLIEKIIFNAYCMISITVNK